MLIHQEALELAKNAARPPTPPPNRTIREGEPICWTCGGGKTSHRFGALGHLFEGRDPDRKPRPDLPLSLPAACLLMGLVLGFVTGAAFMVALRAVVGP